MLRAALKAVILLTDLLALPLAYFCYAFFVGAITVNASHQQPAQGITIYIHSNGFHTDLVLPVNETQTNTHWLSFYADSALLRKHQRTQWMSVGWGDEGFYLDSYNNAFPGLGTCCNALFVPSPSLMHVAFYEGRFSRTELCRPVTLRAAEYEKLCQTIRNSFVLPDNGKVHTIDSPGYWEHDYFFKAKGSYHLFQTCNDWTNDCLQQSGLKASWKAPLYNFVLQHY
ncbi:MAG: TIGR02117 family protein [Bacteroidia bacterium]|jgi:uncharacterized protein (TIGR02117 family)|nr:TIGR02117 family protein [Bacteroidia bacterium]